MGFLDQLLSGITGQGPQAGQGKQGAALFEEVSNLITQSGGVSGLVKQFEQKGLGSMIAGWISTGANPNISGDQVVNAIGQDRVRAIASKVGLSEQEVSQGISKLLPVIVDKLTPSGKVAEQAPAEMQKTLQALKSKFL